MKILVGCEKSRRVASAFEKLGYEAYSCDILPAEQPGRHIQDDVLKHLNDGWDLGIFHPDCTYLANSGVRWIIDNSARYELMIQACLFFNKLLNAPIKYIAVENPIQHKYAREYIRKYDQLIHPWWFGEGETKATCLWLNELPPLMSTLVHPERFGRIWRISPSSERSVERARTYKGVAEAMAHQWSYYIEHKGESIIW